MCWEWPRQLQWFESKTRGKDSKGSNRLVRKLRPSVGGSRASFAVLPLFVLLPLSIAFASSLSVLKPRLCESGSTPLGTATFGVSHVFCTRSHGKIF
jgi:hypothetical protein